jgi:hypothetical protein
MKKVDKNNKEDKKRNSMCNNFNKQSPNILNLSYLDKGDFK